MSKTCIDCGKEIGPQAERCASCNYQWMSENKINPGNYKTGIYCVPHFCIDCQNLVIKPYAKRCKTCFLLFLQRLRSKNPINLGKKFSKKHRINLSLSHGGNGSLKPLNQGYAETFNRELKRKIFERDHFKCQHPGCSGKCRLLTVHHIDYDKQNSSDDNLITLCRSCHPITNFNRQYWEKFYQLFMKNKLLQLIER